MLKTLTVDVRVFVFYRVTKRRINLFSLCDVVKFKVRKKEIGAVVD